MILNRVLSILNSLQLFGHGVKPCVVILDGQRYRVDDAVVGEQEVHINVVAE